MNVINEMEADGWQPTACVVQLFVSPCDDFSLQTGPHWKQDSDTNYMKNGN
jgi:hypothetical protein